MLDDYSLFEQVVIVFVFGFGAICLVGLFIGFFFAVCAEKVRKWKATERGHEMNDETRNIEF